jgi:gamma-glutamyltranspeptidase/glutathione hydrolase
MNFDWNNPYPTVRSPVFARNVVATSEPLGASAGLRMLMRGGNAVDAAIATAAAMTVVEPCSNGLGSDLFAIVWGQRPGTRATSSASTAGASRCAAGTR